MRLAMPAVGLTLFIASVSAADDAPTAPRLPTCITMTSEARANGRGYEHIVHLDNRCGAAASCTVSTSSEPEPIWVDLPDQKDTEVVTSKAANGASFQPIAFCIVDDG